MVRLGEGPVRRPVAGAHLTAIKADFCGKGRGRGRRHVQVNVCQEILVVGFHAEGSFDGAGPFKPVRLTSTVMVWAPSGAMAPLEIGKLSHGISSTICHVSGALPVFRSSN